MAGQKRQPFDFAQGKQGRRKFKDPTCKGGPWGTRKDTTGRDPSAARPGAPGTGAQENAGPLRSG